MSHSFGRAAANEVTQQANDFLHHVHDADIWAAMHHPIRGRMSDADVKRGKDLLAAASSAKSSAASHAGDVHGAALVVDDASTAAEHWLADQTTHARGALLEAADEGALAALDNVRSSGEGYAAVAQSLRNYIDLARRDDAIGHAISASYVDKKSRDAILKDGAHLAEAVDAATPKTGEAKGARSAATHSKDDAVATLARWLHRWTLVAHRVLSAHQLSKVGLDHARHHPAHRPSHPAAVPTAPAAPATPGS
jgi:hypothetical protein